MQRPEGLTLLEGGPARRAVVGIIKVPPVVSVGFTMDVIRREAENASDQNRSTSRKRMRPHPFLLGQTRRLPHLHQIPLLTSLRCASETLGKTGKGRVCCQFKFRPAASPVVAETLKGSETRFRLRLLRGLRRRRHRRRREEECTGEGEEVALEDLFRTWSYFVVIPAIILWKL
ncbi:hypothetical protein EDD85DRAFT_445502 [Armillaria nabsnona]|nr:hypothetical protein EDD85DRAFT_445502 [Armillaria nabsnona]